MLSGILQALAKHINLSISLILFQITANSQNPCLALITNVVTKDAYERNFRKRVLCINTLDLVLL